MEDVLEVYSRPYDASRPQVCLDEGGKQLIGEARPPLPMRPGRVRREDHEYRRNGTANLFMIFEPLRGWRHVEVTERETNRDFALVIRRLVDAWYPEAGRIVLVMDNLGTHTAAALYETFAHVRAGRGASAVGEAGGASHAEARQLAGHGRDGVVGAGAAVPGSADRRRGGIAARGGCVGGRSQPRGGQGGLAVHHGGRTDQAQATLPTDSAAMYH
jgi:hypothetical protein